MQKPIIFDCRSRPRNVPVITGSKGNLYIFWYNASVHNILLQFTCLLLSCMCSHLVFFFSSTTDLQNVNITLRILFRPVTTQLPRIFTSIGEDYDERVLPSITTEVLKSVVVSIVLSLLILVYYDWWYIWYNSVQHAACVIYLFIFASFTGSLWRRRAHHAERTCVSAGQWGPHRESLHLWPYSGRRFTGKKQLYKLNSCLFFGLVFFPSLPPEPLKT